MTASNGISPRSSATSLYYMFGSFLIGLVGLVLGFSPLVGLSLVFTAVFAFDPRLRALAFWPLGLAAVLVLTFALRTILWIAGVERYSTMSAGILLAGASLLMLMFGLLRYRRGKVSPLRLSTIEALVVSIVPAAIVVYATYKFAVEPETLISSYIGGGDHANHISYVQMHLQGTPSQGSLPPWAITGYPQGVHFFLALLVATSGLSNSVNPLVIQSSVASWFEWAQLAAFITLVSVTAIGIRRERSAIRLVAVPLVLLLLLTIPQVVNHLFWSGFTTSLAISWLLLLPTAFIVLMYLEGDHQISEWRAAGLFTLTGILALFSYQIYVVPLMVVPILMFVSSRLGGKYRTPIFSLVAILALLVIPYAVLTMTDFGRGFSSQLLADGALWKPSVKLTFVIVASVVVTRAGMSLISGGRNREERRRSSVVLSYFLLIVATTGSVWWFTWTQEPSFFWDPPYYINKMLWIVVFTGVPIAAMQSMEMIDELSGRFGSKFVTYSIPVLVACALVFGTSTWRASLQNLINPYEVRWFTGPMIRADESVLARSAAFSQTDPLGAHVANLTVRNAGSLAVPIPVGLSASPIRFCQASNSNNIETVFLFEDARNLLYEAGCDERMTYVVDGVSMRATQPDNKILPISRNRSLSIGKLGNQYVQRGFLASETWGRWATGFQSLIGFKMPFSSSSATLTIKYRVATSTPASGQGVFRVDGEFIRQIDLDDKSSGAVELSLGDRSAGDTIKVTIACSWSVEEAESIRQHSDAPSCIGVEEFRLEIDQVP